MRERPTLVAVILESVLLFSLAVFPFVWGEAGDADVTRYRNLQGSRLEPSQTDVTRFRNLQTPTLKPDFADTTRHRNLQSPLLESGNVDVTRLRNLQSPLMEPGHTDVIRLKNLQSPQLQSNNADVTRLKNLQFFEMGETVYFKPPYPDYALSGMPDFDQRQWGTYNWTDASDNWSHCGPVACANSIWWLDSKFEPNPITPPTINDGFPLLQEYGSWDDHDPQNVPSFIEHLAWLMDCDGRRTGQTWWGTYVDDMKAGLAQYLSWSGTNSLGDINADGVVNQTDIDTVNAAMGTTPTDPNWNLAADVFPATTSYPPTTDNIVDANDLAIVDDHVGEGGTFSVHTEHAYEDSEFFDLIRQEVERCQDVVLLLGFYNTTDGHRVGGHYITVAGVDPGKLELLTSDPIRDDFEAGNTPGRSPVPHSHPLPEPPHTTHNNASLVSQDAYNATLTPSSNGYLWLIQDYFEPEYNLEARIEYAVITSPLLGYDVAVVDVTPSKTIVCQGYSVNVVVTVDNQVEFFTKTVTVTTYANTIVVNQTQVTLPSLGSTTFTFTWNTTDEPYGNYTMCAVADTIPGEMNTSDNILVNGNVLVTVPGDVNGDRIVDTHDLHKIGKAYGAIPSNPNWIEACDINGDEIIDEKDLSILEENYGKSAYTNN